ncbi:ATP-binding cassette domain-containing protein [Clostridium sp. MSJ-8]|uniref:ABC transporter ATP-binding protein n=1 Tax=Clostridium sp. MSJ-8 TaxID=2841510 RepID=UPI001C0ECDEE|nr:ATP-binding cassette domain-containing protein [Clostridium sp. MSJ-8]MBU5488777.1 ATP-binding cassette domain-containing protein [Clostridium sp. MSJ-8]
MIKLVDVSYITEDKFQILNNINLTIDDSKFVVITGPNGGGKSTLAKVIVGIIKPTSGKIYFNDIDITDMSITERAKLGISFAFQQPVRFKGITVRDLITLAANREISTEEINSYLNKVGLDGEEYIDREVNSSLSGGEMKRIEIAMVMAKDTKLYVFDEPEAGIDIWSFKNLISVFTEMRKNNKSNSMIIISHQERIMDIADDIVVISEGKVISHDSREEILPCLLEGTNRQCCKKNTLEVQK